MALLATQYPTTQGTVVTYAAASGGGGDTFVPADNAVLHVKNGGGSSTNVTLATPSTVDGDLTVQDRVVAVANGADKFIRIPPAIYRDASTGVGTVTYSVTTSVTVAVIGL
ncbi:MAG TPA: hypothetical protein VF069_05925 [Streptosporangiaceae bacterium]